jgi:Inovirus Gp2
MLKDYSYSREILEEYEHINEILNDIKRQFDVMIENHCKVLLVHFVLRFPAGTFHQRNNEEISEFIKKLTNYYEYRRVATRYIWGREQLTSCAPHYHVALLLDGSQRHHTLTIWDEAAEIWSRITNGPHALLHRCWHAPIGGDGNGGIMIRRPSSKAIGNDLYEQEQAFQNAYIAALNWTSYLAKEYSKENTPFGVRRYGSSRL